MRPMYLVQMLLLLLQLGLQLGVRTVLPRSRCMRLQRESHLVDLATQCLLADLNPGFTFTADPSGTSTVTP